MLGRCELSEELIMLPLLTAIIQVYSSWKETNFSTQWCYENYIQVHFDISIYLIQVLLFSFIILTQNWICNLAKYCCRMEDWNLNFSVAVNDFWFTNRFLSFSCRWGVWSVLETYEINWRVYWRGLKLNWHQTPMI